MGCGGQETEFSWENVIPPWQQKIAEQLASQLQAQAGQGATPLPENFPLASQMDPMQLAAAQTMMGIGGYGNYQQPGWLGMSDYGSGPGVASGPYGPSAVTASGRPPAGPAAPIAYAGPVVSGPLPSSAGPSAAQSSRKRGPVTRAAGAALGIDPAGYSPYYDPYMGMYGQPPFIPGQPPMPPWWM